VGFGKDSAFTTTSTTAALSRGGEGAGYSESVNTDISFLNSAPNSSNRWSTPENLAQTFFWHKDSETCKIIAQRCDEPRPNH
jgi:hypothetical protein